MRRPQNRDRRGLTLVETGLALALLAMVLAGFFALTANQAERRNAANASERLASVAGAARDYLVTYQKELKAAAAGGAVRIPVARTAPTGAVPAGNGALPSLQGGDFLSGSFVDRNAYGQSHAMIVRAVGQRLEAMVTTVGGRAIPDRTLGSVAAAAGGNSGFMLATPMPGTAGFVTGSGGAWAASASDWQAGGSAPAVGHVASVMALDDGRDVTDFLARQDTGIPEANRMRTDLYMDENNLEEVAKLTRGTKSFLVPSTAALATSRLAGKTGISRVGRDLAVPLDLRASGDLLAQRDANVDKLLRSNEIRAGQDVRTDPAPAAGADNHMAFASAAAKGDIVVRNGGDVVAPSFVDVDDPSYKVVPKSLSTFADVSPDRIDGDAVLSGDALFSTPPGGNPDWLADRVMHRTRVVKATDRSRATAWCNADEVRVSCSGARVYPLADTCNEESCGMVGNGAVESGGRQGCQTVIDYDGNNTIATAAAICMTGVTGGDGGADPSSGVGNEDGDEVDECPVWAPGDYPNCVMKNYPPPSCPAWAPGNYPNCVVNRCPDWARGTFPNCPLPSYTIRWYSAYVSTAVDAGTGQTVVQGCHEQVLIDNVSPACSLGHRAGDAYTYSGVPSRCYISTTAISCNR